MKCWVLHSLYILATVFLCACKPDQEKQTGIDLATLKKMYRPEFAIKPGEIRKFIKQECDSAHTQTPTHISVNHFYQTGGHFLWLGKHMLNQQADSLIHWLENSSQHGLNPELLYLLEIKKDLEKINTLKFGKRENINNILARLEYNLTKAYLRYTCGLSFGFVDPHKIFNELEDEDKEDGKPHEKLPNGETPKKELYCTPLKSCDTAFVLKALNQAKENTAAAFLHYIQPSHPFYTLLQKELKRTEALKDRKFPDIPGIGDTLLKVGDRHRIIPLIARRLEITGELTENKNPPTNITLTRDLLNAINHFRKENRIASDSSIGNFTIKALNRPIGYYTNRLRANLERLRWQPTQAKGDKYILINLAAYMLQAFDVQIDTIMEIKICIGSAGNKTPLLSSTIRYVEMNPYWNVPQSIIIKEMIPAYKKDSSYFSKNRFRIYDKEGREISPHTINWSKYQTGVPFELKQDNKDGNSLGRMIFRFPNTHSIYLHDSPSRYAFRYNNRAISHGCIRLEKPLELAFFLIGKKKETIKDRIRLAIDLPPLSEKGKKLKDKVEYKQLEYYSFEPCIPLFIEYYTNYLSKEGELSYCEDFYQFDPPLLDALDKLN